VAITWQEETVLLQQLLSAIEISDLVGRQVAVEEGFHSLQSSLRRIREYRNTMFLIGNGASAAMASHYSADLAKNGHIHTQVFSDLSLITALSNDIGYDYVFSIPLERRAVEGDMLVAISSSGRSRNILNAVKVARRLKVAVVTLSAMDQDNPLRVIGDLNFYIPAKTYGHAETGHAAILHHMMDKMDLSSAQRGH
jgi:D-sedoheptulose 7-phosphate isomerase